jgi:molybdopterin molybdotransferase
MNKQAAKSADKHFRIDVNTASELISAAMPDFGASPVELEAASGRVLRQSITAERDQPPFDRATMDGISIAGAAFENGARRFKIAGIQAAGHAQKTLPDAAHCLEVMTGAVMPAGADTVVPVERITVQDNHAELESGYTPALGQFVHRRASDHSRQDQLLKPGIRIGGPDMAILTAAGQANVLVANDPRISVISTGDELVDVGTSIADHQIRSSNDRAIKTILRGRDYHRVERAHLRDDRAKLLKQVHKLHAENDVLILSGGVSMGKYDYVPAILEELGVELVFHKILQRPGLPMWFGVSREQKPVFALPGNPVSTLVCLVRYVIPALDLASGQSPLVPEFVPLAEAVEFAPDLCWFLPVKLTSKSGEGWLAQPRPTNTSGDFIGLRETDGFIELPRGQDHFPANYKARLFRW